MTDKILSIGECVTYCSSAIRGSRIVSQQPLFRRAKGLESRTMAGVSDDLHCQSTVSMEFKLDMGRSCVCGGSQKFVLRANNCPAARYFGAHRSVAFERQQCGWRSERSQSQRRIVVLGLLCDDSDHACFQTNQHGWRSREGGKCASIPPRS